MAEAQPIRLLAKDAEDLAVVASCLQDALVPLGEMRFLQGEKRFVMLVNRFRWEQAGHALKPQQKGDASYADVAPDQRINSGLCIDGVTTVRSRGLDREKQAKFLSLMTIGLDGPNRLNLLFSGGGTIQLEIESPSVFLQDFGEGWPTQWRPDHSVDRRVGDRGARDRESMK
jgi:hypothetical protein